MLFRLLQGALEHPGLSLSGKKAGTQGKAQRKKRARGQEEAPVLGRQLLLQVPRARAPPSGRMRKLRKQERARHKMKELEARGMEKLRLTDECRWAGMDLCDPFLSVPDSPVHNKAAYNT